MKKILFIATFALSINAFAQRPEVTTKVEYAESWVGTSPHIYHKYIKTYDVNNNLVNEVDQIKGDTSWVNVEQCICTFEGNKMVSQIKQTWNGIAWVNKSSWVAKVKS